MKDIWKAKKDRSVERRRGDMKGFGSEERRENKKWRG